MPLSLRCHSVNTYCLSKVWFKCASVDLRAGDASLINSSIKSWVYADQLIKPEELVLYKSRQMGGLNLTNVKYRAMAEMIKSFLDTSINPAFRKNVYHQALFSCSPELFDAIKAVKKQGLLRLSNITIGIKIFCKSV